MVNLKQDLQSISNYAGNRFDLVQAGGGNTSVKISATQMLVKASGINLSEVTEYQGYVEVDYFAIRQFLATEDFSDLDRYQRESAANDVMLNSRLASNGVPSIETFLHALLSTYTLHTHPISVNILTAKKTWKLDLSEVWPDAIFVPYHTPGIDLALAMSNEMNAYTTIYGQYPKVAFLQNHGLIVSSNDPEEVIQLTEQVTNMISEKIGLNLNRYQNVTSLQKLLSEQGFPNTSIIFCEDAIINRQLVLQAINPKSAPEFFSFCPDTFIYCGVHPVFLNNIDDHTSIQQYSSQYQDHPKVMVINNQVYFCANSLKKAQEAQELFKFHLLVSSHSHDQLERLNMSEVSYLANWDAEKFRQGV
jgi:rhamnose utilization protein RhaD (predicted bifunctional aldolase and dehydrogenase)